MDVTQKVEASVAVLVRMGEDGKVSGRVVGHLAYATAKEIPKKKGEDGEDGGEPKVFVAPMTSADVEFDDADRAEVAKVLAEIVKKHQEQLAGRLSDARAEARRVARVMGELI